NYHQETLDKPLQNNRLSSHHSLPLSRLPHFSPTVSPISLFLRHSLPKNSVARHRLRLRLPHFSHFGQIFSLHLQVMSKGKKNKVRPETGDVDQIQSEVASFASSLGFASSLPSSGFNDVDFRPKAKPISNQIKKPSNQPQQEKQSPQGKKKGNLINSQNGEKKNNKASSQKPVPKATQIKSRTHSGVGASNKLYERFKNLPKLPLVKANALEVWYADAAELEEKIIGGQSGKFEIGNPEEWKTFVEKKKEMGERLLVQYTMDYDTSRGQSGDIKMLLTTQRSGTAADKVSAYSVLIGDNPLANLRALDALLAMITSKVGKRHALTCFEALKELFVQSLLPDRKLKTLLQQPLKLLPETKDGYSLLLFWYWEDCLKNRYDRFISAIEEASRDMLPILKDKALRTIYNLLKSKSEQEQRLLSALVNKLGDPENKSASNADYHLSNLLSEHPNMKSVVISEVDSFLFRPRLNLRAKYHAVNFLSQTRLGHRGDGPKLAKQLINVYFAVFKVLMSEMSSGAKADENGKKATNEKPSRMDNKGKGSSDAHVELDSRLLSALLTGVNRAFPFVSSNEADEILEVQTPMLFQLVHSKNFNVGIQALTLLDKISSKNQVEMFIGLLLRALKNDINLKRVAAFSKRILQVALQQPPQYACGCLFLISEALKARPPLWNMVLQNESVDEELEHFEDAPDETDIESITKKEEPKSNDNTGPKSNVLEKDDSDSSSDEDEIDAPLPSSSEDDASDGDEDVDFLVKDKSREPINLKLESSNKIGDQHQESNSNSKTLSGGYDPQHREPSYCNAEHASWWELMVLASHAHPSVSTMARTILSGASIVYNGNPLHDLSLSAFLDKFMEKKPKQSTWHGGSQIEPAKKLEMNEHLIGPEIISLAESEVPPEDLVFHRFYTNKMNSSKKPKKKKKKSKKGGADDEAAEELYGGGDESDNGEIEDMLDAAEPGEEEGEYDYDDLDRLPAEDEDDMIADVSDNEVDPSDEDDVPAFSDDDNDIIDVGDADDGSDDSEEGGGSVGKGKKKRKKLGGKASSSKSPFASLEEYEHLLVDEDEDNVLAAKEKTYIKKKSKSNKKRKVSK
ncbi:hypothetical protein V2J09_004360, partial [Rumex salicifolius]